MVTLEEYLNLGISPYHVVDNTKQALLEEGFTELSIGDNWEIKKGEGYFVSPYESMLIAFRPGGDKLRIATAHTDQPMLKLKPNPVIDREGNIVVNVEAYGGMLLNTWFDRPLALAGKVVCRSEETFKPNVLLYDSKSPIAVIPSLAIHLNREANKKNELKTQVHLLPLIAIDRSTIDDEDILMEYVADELDVNAEDILDYDLFFYNPEKATKVGVDKDILVSPRLDNLTSCYSAVHGLISTHNTNSKDKSATCVVALFDHEEIGSRSKQGADSTMLMQVMSKLMATISKKSRSMNFNHSTIVENGFVMSMDVAHAFHPNYKDKSDPTTRTMLGSGVVLKTSGSQKYNSDAVSNGALMQLCDKYNINYQRQINNSDIAGGSTMGPIISAYLPIPGVDVGVGVLAMHSAVETASIEDCMELNRLAEAFFLE